MSWLKRIQPVALYQSSDLPYVICENGVRLCHTNMYSTSKSKPDKSEHFIAFTANKHDLMRQSTHYYKYINFPVTIPFDSVIACDNVIIEGRVIKNATTISDEQRNITLIRSEYIHNLDDEHWQNLIETIEESDNSFLLVGEEIPPQARLLNEMVTTIYHDDDWGRTCVAIADMVAPSSYRKYCWTDKIPELQISCYGLDGNDDMSAIQDTFNYMGVPNFSVIWEDSNTSTTKEED